MSDSKKVLVVEGSASLADMIRSGLEKAGYEATTVDSGRDAWDQVGNGYDLLVTDYAMSDMVGTKICEGIRQHRKHKNMPMVVLCAERGVDLGQLKSDLNLVEAFKKPLSVNELVTSINGHFGIGDAPAPPAAEEAPAEEPAAEEAPAEEPAAEEAPAEAPAEEAPAEAPAEEPPADSAPEQSQGEAAPAEPTASDESPVDDSDAPTEAPEEPSATDPEKSE